MKPSWRTPSTRSRCARPATRRSAHRGRCPGSHPRSACADALVVADDSIAAAPNLTAGANLEGFHLRNVNCGRDYQPDTAADIAAARDGDACPECGAPMQARRGVEVGNIFQLGTRYSEPMECLLSR